VAPTEPAPMIASLMTRVYHAPSTATVCPWDF
jgi:hypothetical protein